MAKRKANTTRSDVRKRSEAPAVTLYEPTPSSDPVHGADLLDRVVTTVQSHLALPQYAAEAVALWALHTHTFDSFAISPRLAILSPEKQCGKTTLLTLLSGLVPRPLMASNVTTAGVFRVIEAYRPTLLIDEADTFFAAREELRGILNSGHNRRTSTVLRLVGDAHEPKLFSTWAPVAIAAIKDIADTLMDRSIVIRMRRRLPTERILPIRLDRMDHLDLLSSEMARFAVDNCKSLAKADPQLPTSLPDRAQDNWRPLVALADAAGGKWPDLAREAALALSARAEETSLPVQLLEDLHELFRSTNATRLSTIEILHGITAREDRPWAEWRNAMPITANSVAQLLRPFGITPFKFRPSPTAAPVNGYDARGVAGAVARYSRHRPQLGTSEQPTDLPIKSLPVRGDWTKSD